jgi:hypothetical protein
MRDRGASRRDTADSVATQDFKNGEQMAVEVTISATC